jgi:putative oxidoreductase
MIQAARPQVGRQGIDMAIATNIPSGATWTIGPLSADDAGKLLLRVALGVLMLLHGVGKLEGGIAAVVGMVGKTGLPGALGYAVYLGEVVAPLLLLVGLFTRPAALVVAVNMVVAVLLVHTGQLATLSPTGGWALELQALYLTAALAIALFGAGRASVGGAQGRWN